MKKNILILGGYGYLGSVIIQKIYKKFSITVFDKCFFLNKKILDKKIYKKVKLIKKNFNKITSKDFRDIYAVIDLGGIPNDPSGEVNKTHTWNLNYKLRTHIAKLAKKNNVKFYIFNSTCSIYGFNKKPVNEYSKKNPLTTYAKANFRSDKEIYNLRSKSFNVAILRNATLFGFSASMRLDLVVNIFIHNILNKKNVLIDGNGKQFRPFISVNDVARIYENLLSQISKSFICNLVAYNYRIEDILKKIKKSLKKKINFNYNINNTDKRNYYVVSKNFKKYFPNFKFSSFNKEIKILYSSLSKYKLKRNKKTVRLKFYNKYDFKINEYYKFKK
jgi:nucleoside-diphosphate-sugar epimerase